MTQPREIGPLEREVEETPRDGRRAKRAEIIEREVGTFSVSIDRRTIPISKPVRATSTILVVSADVPERDDPRIFIEGMHFMVPDGTFREAVHPLTGATVLVPNHREDPEAALRAVVAAEVARWLRS
jgi:hypothetical protein